MKVEDLHKTKIAQPEIGQIDLYNPDGISATIFGTGDGEFESQDEALKAAALFRAAYQMQAAIKAAIAWFEEGGAKGYPAHKKCVAALELSENTDEKIS